VDPLDGTANFLHGHPVHAASVGVAVDGVVAAGAVSCATTGERWWARRGQGAWKSGRRIAVSDARCLEGGLIGTGFPFKVQHLIPAYLEELGHVLRAGAGVRRAGAAALDLCYVAEGRLDGFWESFLNPWDFAAGIVIHTDQ
jgi:myo-inositol-1(or 4)-monophosphatase